MQPKTVNRCEEKHDVPGLEKYVPALFIGLGGTGKEVLMRLRRRLYETGGPAARPYLRYLMIDTDIAQTWPANTLYTDYKDVLPKEGESVDVQIQDNEFTHVFQLLEQQHDPLYTGWLKPELKKLRNAIYSGAGTFRPLGRIAFMLRYQLIRDHIERHLTAMLHDVATLDARELRNVMIETNTVEVVIVTSLAGGTGAGMFLDIAYLVRDVLNSHSTLSNLRKKYTTLIATLPTVYKSEMDPGQFFKLQQNAYAALLELEHYGTIQIGDDVFLGERRTRRGQRSSVGFVAPWKQNQLIEGQGWDTCFLIDNVNPLREYAALKPIDTYQMIADYLFLDFQESEFAIRKRSTRSNLAQYRLDYSLTYVQSEAVKAELGDQVVPGTDIVYATRSGRGFSSFGLAEISFSSERFYRAAGYLLAALLVKDRWLGDAGSRQPGEYQQDAKTDFYSPRTGEFSFRPDAILANIYQVGGRNWYAEAARECSEAKDKIHFTRGSSQLRQMQGKHKSLLQQPNGEAARAASERTAVLAGTAQIPGEIRERIEAMAHSRANQYGVAVTRQLLNNYREMAEYLSRSGVQLGRWDDTAMPRLDEADDLYFPARTLGQKITFSGACEATKTAVLNEYMSTAAPHIQKLMVKVRDYIGRRGEGKPAELDQWGTLNEYFQKAEDQLSKISDQLNKRFRDFSTEGDSVRSQTLSPTWPIEMYGEQIRRALIACSAVGPGASDKTFNWERLEEAVFRQLSADNPQEFLSVTSLTSLLKYWFDRKMTGNDDIKTICETLGSACRAFLKQRVGSLGLENYHNGSVTELLRLNDTPEERKRRLEKLIWYSSPFLPLRIPTGGDSTAAPKFNNLIGAKSFEDTDVPGARERLRLVMEEIRALSVRDNANLGQGNPLPADEFSLLICREVWGIPLQYYASLDDLYAAYEERVRLRTVDECHINYNETSEDLPDVRQIRPDRWESIEKNVEDAVFARIVGWIYSAREFGRTSYYVGVPGPVGVVPIRLGSRIGRIIMKACEEPRIAPYLNKSRSDWEREAARSPKRWAMVYASAAQTLESTRADFGDPNTTPISPLRNCMTALVMKFARHLEVTDEGQRWLEYLRIPIDDRPEFRQAWDAKYNDLVEVRKILTCESPDVPIFQVNWRLADQLQLPDQAFQTPTAGSSV